MVFYTEKAGCTKIIFILLIIVICLNNVSCAQLEADDTVAYPLSMVSLSKPPASEDIRSFVQLDDLIYTAAGSGGMLVYRIEGDSIQPELSLSLTNLYSEEIETVYIRTVEIVKTKSATNLVFAYDTLLGGGVGLAEITPMSTLPIGTLKTIPKVRIRKTVTTSDSKGVFHILAANEGVGVLSYDLSFSSNNLSEQVNIASLVEYVTMNVTESPIKKFEALSAPSLQIITNISQITNIDALISLSTQNPQIFSSVVGALPFLNKEQRREIGQMVQTVDSSQITDVLSTVKGVLGDQLVDQILQNPEMISQLAGTKLDPNMLKKLQQSLANKDISSLVMAAQNIPDMLLTGKDLQSMNQNILETNTIDDIDLTTLSQGKAKINLNKIHNKQYNPFTDKKEVGNASFEIQKTIESLGRRFFGVKDQTVKEKLSEFTQEDFEMFFSTLFDQVTYTAKLIPIFAATGIDIKDLYELWKNKQYEDIIERLDADLIAELFRLLPPYQVQTKLEVRRTNIVLPSVRYMESDAKYLYLAAGFDGFLIANKKNNKIVSKKKQPFSEVTCVVPYEVYGQKYFVVTDTLDGLVVYKRLSGNRIGEFIDRISLVGESLFVLPYEDVLWVADGSNGVLGVRFNKNQSMVIESELYDKKGVACFIGSARRRETLVSYGSQGLVRVRVTNIMSDATNKSMTGKSGDSQEDQKKDLSSKVDFIDVTLEWGQNSPIAEFLKKIMFL